MARPNPTEADLEHMCRNGARVRGEVRAEAPAIGRSGGHGRSQRPSGADGRLQKPIPSPLLSLSITGQLPSGKNAVRTTRAGKHYPVKRFTNWRARAHIELLEQLTKDCFKSPDIATPVRLICDYWPGDQRTRDITGMLDALFHLLVYSKVLKDDGLVHDVIWRRHELNRKFPKVVMEIEIL